jgi:hypothetical protein
VLRFERLSSLRDDGNKEGTIEIVPLRPLAPEERLREYGDDEIERFLQEDRLDPDTAARVRRLLGRKGPA